MTHLTWIVGDVTITRIPGSWPTCPSSPCCPKRLRRLSPRTASGCNRISSAPTGSLPISIHGLLVDR